MFSYITDLALTFVILCAVWAGAASSTPCGLIIQSPQVTGLFVTNHSGTLGLVNPDTGGFEDHNQAFIRSVGSQCEIITNGNILTATIPQGLADGTHCPRRIDDPVIKLSDGGDTYSMFAWHTNQPLFCIPSRTIVKNAKEKVYLGKYKTLNDCEYDARNRSDVEFYALTWTENRCWGHRGSFGSAINLENANHGDLTYSCLLKSHVAPGSLSGVVKAARIAKVNEQETDPDYCYKVAQTLTDIVAVTVTDTECLLLQSVTGLYPSSTTSSKSAFILRGHKVVPSTSETSAPGYSRLLASEGADNLAVAPVAKTHPIVCEVKRIKRIGNTIFTAPTAPSTTTTSTTSTTSSGTVVFPVAAAVGGFAVAGLVATFVGVKVWGGAAVTATQMGDGGAEFLCAEGEMEIDGREQLVDNKFEF